MVDKPRLMPAGLWRICCRIGGGLAPVVSRFIVRLYALMILLVVVWAGYTAVAYLVRTVFYPTRVPKQFLTYNVTPDASQLRSGQLLAATHGPIGHYHGVDRWFQPDPHNGCEAAGCHKPLPHTLRKEVRAFANFHSTFLSCATCHDATVKGATPALWVSTATGEVQDPPALLQLTRLLQVDREKIASAPAEFHPRIVDLLRNTVSAAGEDPLLNYLLLQLNTSEPGSPVWRRTVDQLATELPNQARGEYMAKITPEKDAAAMPERNQKLFELAARYSDAPANSPQREQLHKEIHTDVLAKPEACLTCHGGEPRRLDLEALGYSPQRASELRGSMTARLIQRIREGQPFNLPQVLEGGHAH